MGTNWAKDTEILMSLSRLVDDAEQSFENGSNDFLLRVLHSLFNQAVHKVGIAEHDFSPPNGNIAKELFERGLVGEGGARLEPVCEVVKSHLIPASQNSGNWGIRNYNQ